MKLAVVRVDLEGHSGREAVTTSDDRSQETRLLKWDGDERQGSNRALKAKFLQE